MADTQSRPKKVLPTGKPILCLFHTMPKEGKPAVFDGNSSPRISLRFDVADNKYPDLQGYRVYRRFNPYINNYNSKATHLYKLICEMVQHEIGPEWCRVDARDLSENEWSQLWGYYVLKMEPPEFAEDGTTVRWQDVAEILNPDGIEFPVDARKLELRPEHQREALGSPIPKAQPAPEPAPQEPAPEPEPAPAPVTRPSTKEPTVAETDAWIKENRLEHIDLIRSFVRIDRRVATIGELSETDRQHLYYLMQVNARLEAVDEEKRRVAMDVVHQHLELRGSTSFEDLKTSDLRLLMTTIDAEISGDVPF